MSGAGAPPLAARLALRGRLRSAIRQFFAERGVVEVDTPALSPAGNPDPAVEPLTTAPHCLGGRTHFLQTSPEFAMKRLLAAGSGDIWQLCRVFRDGELGRWHEPEFMMLEWYRLGFDDGQLMDEVAALLEACLADGRPLPTLKLTYRELCRRVLGVDPHGAAPEVASAVTRRLTDAGIPVPTSLGADACLDLAMTTLVIPSLPRRSIVFIHDYPASQASLARLKATSPPVAARFEVFVDGIELGNGFHELADAVEQRARFLRDAATREAARAVVPPVDEGLLAALEKGLPECAGVAIGFDRLVAVAAGAARLADAIDLPHVAPG